MNEKKEYIERKALREEFERILPDFGGEMMDGEIMGVIDNMESADVAPVVHGEWLSISDDDQYEGEYYCSVCNSAEFFPGYTPFSPFCWHCGAKMDGGQE